MLKIQEKMLMVPKTKTLYTELNDILLRPQEIKEEMQMATYVRYKLEKLQDVGDI